MRLWIGVVGIRIPESIVCLTAAAAIAGCGSGGNSTPTPPQPTTPTITWATPAAITYGTALSSSQLDATASVAGTFSYSPASGTLLTAGANQKLSVTFTPTDTTAYTSATGSVTLTVNQAMPALVWATPVSIVYGTALGAAQLDATASVAGTFAYSPAAGTQLIAGANQKLSVTFTPTDTTDYTSASASVNLTVSQAVPTLTWATPTATTYGTALSLTQLDATANTPGAFVYSPISGTTLTAGSQTLSVTFMPTDTLDYQNATGQVTLTVNKATPTITWAAPAAVAQGTALSSTQLDATASVPGSFVYSPAAGTVMNTAGTVSLSTTFTPTDSTDYASATVGVTLTVNAATPTATVNFGTPEQTIRGFGGSTAWLGQLTTQQANALYSPTSGLGLSILRVRIDPTGTLANSWVPTNGGWLTEVSNAQGAVNANPNAIVFATPWTPPTSMKTSSTSQPYYSGTCSPSSGYCGGYLNPTSYAAYASYLEDFVTYFNAHSTFNLYAISMQNEPDYANVNYESCNWTAAQMDAWIDSLTAGGATNPLTAKLIMPESFQFIQAQAATAMGDANAEPLISILGGHIYGVSPTIAYYNLAQANSKQEVWMTEHALTPGGSLPTIADALSAAEEVHNSMVTGSYNAYVWWWIWDNPNDGVNYGLINSSTTSPAPTYYGYAIGQYSKFVQPGYSRYNATNNPTSNVFVSAYSGTQGGTQHYVIVAINASGSAVSLPFNIQNATVTSLTPYQTTSTGGMVQQSAVNVTSGAFTYSLPAQSITTFVQ
jgi:O-glycosyl hydrolase